MGDKGSVFDKCVDMDWDAVWKLIEPREVLQSECDDVGGILTVMVGPDGDAHLMLDEHPRAKECGGGFGKPTYRARTYAGDGRNEKVRVALILLMLAIKEGQDK